MSLTSDISNATGRVSDVGDFDINYQNFVAGLNKDANFVSPKFVFNLSGQFDFDSIDSHVAIKIIEIGNSGISKKATKESDELLLQLEFDSVLVRDVDQLVVENAKQIDGYISIPGQLSGPRSTTVSVNDILELIFWVTVHIKCNLSRYLMI